jgi:asparagine synthase (glutamine-hydrolysing)
MVLKVIAVNGEIYNHKNLKNTLTSSYNFRTESDCEVILALYENKGVDFLNESKWNICFCSL